MRVRPATPADAPRIAEIHVETWQAAYRGLMPETVLAALDQNRRAIFWQRRLAAKPAGVSVAAMEGKPIGFCDVIPSRDADASPVSTGEIASLYVQPACWRQGAGAALCHHALAQARLQHCSTVTLWVLRSNRAAQLFYEAMGFHLEGSVKIDHSLTGHELEEVRYEISL